MPIARTPSSIGIIGYGEFGTFLHTLFTKYAPQIPVRVYSSRREADLQTFFSFEDVCAADILIPTVPIHAYEDTLRRALPHLGAHTIVCDVATVKVHTTTLLHTLGIPHYIATHPMFGPHSYTKHGESLAGLRIVICESTLEPETLAALTTFLESLGLVCLTMSADAHDRHVAGTLFLTHLVGQAVHTAGFDRTPVDTVSFGYLMDAVESVSHDTQLFHDMYTYNPHCREVVVQFTKALSAVSPSA